MSTPPSASDPGEPEPVVGAGPLAVLQLGLGDGGAEVDVPEGGGGRVDRPGPAGQQAQEAPLGHPLGPVRHGGVGVGPVHREAEHAPELLEDLLVLLGELVAERHEVGSGDGDRLLRRAAPAARSRGRRAGSGRSGPRSSSAPGARWAGRCRPSPWGRRRPGPASAGSGPRRRCGCRRRRGRCGGSPTRWAAGCRWRRPAPGWRSGRRRRCPSASHRADQVASSPSSPGFSGIPVGSGPRPRAHDRVTVPCVLQLHDTATGEVAPLRLREPGRVSMYVCGPTVYGVPHLGHGRFSLVFDVLRRYLLFTGLDVTYVSNITDIEDKIIDRAPSRGMPDSEFTATYEALWWEVMDALGRAAARRDPPRHRLRRPDGRARRRPGRPGRRLRDRRRRLPVGAGHRPATGCWPTSPSTPSGPAPGSRPTRRSGHRWTSCCGRRPRPVSPRGTRPGGRAAGLAHRVRGDVPRPAGRRLRTPRGGPSI